MKKTVADIDPVTRVGPDSSDLIAGPSNRAAPLSMKLRNEKIMVKRSRGENAVPLLLYSGALNRYANRLLFSPWRELESLDVDREDIESARERQARLELFPMGVFADLQEDVGNPLEVLVVSNGWLEDTTEHTISHPHGRQVPAGEIMC